MRHRVKVTVIDKKCFPELQKAYLADPESGPCGCFEVGDRFEFWREPGRDDFYHLGRHCGPDGRDFPCGEAWDCISRYVYTALQGGSIMHRWCADERQMVACCNDGTRPVVFLIEREDVPETEREAELLAEAEATGEFTNTLDDAYTGLAGPHLAPPEAQRHSAKRICAPDGRARFVANRCQGPCLGTEAK